MVIFHFLYFLQLFNLFCHFFSFCYVFVVFLAFCYVLSLVASFQLYGQLNIVPSPWLSRGLEGK